MNRRNFIKGLGALALSVVAGCRKKDESEWPITPTNETIFSLKHIAPPLLDNMGIDLSKVYEVSSGLNLSGGPLSAHDIDMYYSRMSHVPNYQYYCADMTEDMTDV